MRLSPFFVVVPPLLATASPIRPQYENLQEPLALAHASISEIECAQGCTDDDSLKNPCTDDDCRNYCKSFSAAYWSGIQKCIARQCNTKTKLGLEYVRNLKQAVDNHCALMDILFNNFESEDEYQGGDEEEEDVEYYTPVSTYTTDDPVTKPKPVVPDPKQPNPKPPCRDPKRPKKHKDCPPPLKK